jgi:hypothetical protein
MIPPQHIRSIRSCEECIFFNALEEYCSLHEDALYQEKLERWEHDDPSLPCPYHFTPDEIMELIELHGESDEHRPMQRNSVWTAQ